MKKRANRESGQALAEFAVVVVLMTLLVFGLIDISRGIYETEVITNLTREGSNLASRGTDMQTATNLMVSQSDLPSMSNLGKVIISQVTNNNGQYVITNQTMAGSYAGSSRVGAVGGNAALPASARSIPLNGQSLYVTEVYYQYVPVTPIGALMTLVSGSSTNLPTAMYDIAYF